MLPDMLDGHMTDAFRIAEESLARFCIEALMASSVPEADARETTAAMIFADKRGIASHGCSILPGYMHHLRASLPTKPPMRSSTAMADWDR
jgi:LDH2 family malate/lactate/ureidoglycolate dehydrogenase